MSQPLEITEALEVLDRALTPPREIAAERVREFKLDREKGEKPLGVANQHCSNFSVLNTDEIVNRSVPNHATIAKTAESLRPSTALSQNLFRRFRWLGKILPHRKRKSAHPLSILKT